MHSPKKFLKSSSLSPSLGGRGGRVERLYEKLPQRSLTLILIPAQVVVETIKKPLWRDYSSSNPEFHAGGRFRRDTGGLLLATSR